MATARTIPARNGRVRVAIAADLVLVGELLGAHGMTVADESLAARIAGDDCGILLGNRTTLSWTLDGGVMHLYDVAGAPDGLHALVVVVERIARERFVAVLATTLAATDPALPALTACGFEPEWIERDVVAGTVVEQIDLVRIVR